MLLVITPKDATVRQIRAEAGESVYLPGEHMQFTKRLVATQ